MRQIPKDIHHMISRTNNPYSGALPPLSPAIASNPVLAPPVPATHFSSLAPTAPVEPSSSSPPMASIHITTQDFLTIMVVVCNFTVTSQSFAVAQAARAECMARTEAVLTENTTILGQVQQHLSLKPIPLTPAAATT